MCNKTELPFAAITAASLLGILSTSSRERNLCQVVFAKCLSQIERRGNSVTGSS